MTTNPRIASLIPSGTDLSAALGFADCLVGVSHECDHPDADDLPVLTSSSIPPPTVDGPSIDPAEIDRLVSASVQAGDSLYITDRPLLHSLAPTIVVSQDVCDVCAVNAESAACDIPVGADLVLLTATSLDGLKRDIVTLAGALGAPGRGDALVAGANGSLDTASLTKVVKGSIERVDGRNFPSLLLQRELESGSRVGPRPMC